MATEEKVMHEINNNVMGPITSTEVVDISDRDGVGSDVEDMKSRSMSEIKSKYVAEQGVRPNLRKDTSFLEVPTQIHITAKIEVHSKEMVYHHLWSCCRCAQHKGKAYEEQLYKNMDNFILDFVYNPFHILAFSISTLVYVLFILLGWYRWHHAMTSFVYAWFIFHQVALLLTANYRLFKIFFQSFAFWYKIINVAVGIFARQLCFDGTERFTASPWHGLSGVLCIFTFIFANAIVGAIQSYYWPEITLCICGNEKKLDLGRYLKTVLILFMLILNGVQTFQLYFSHNDYVWVVFGYTISLRNAAMSAFNSANLWYIQQIISDIIYPGMIMTGVPFEWVHDDSSYDIKDPRFSDLVLRGGKNKMKKVLNVPK